jgi:hypothetical protein
VNYKDKLRELDAALMVEMSFEQRKAIDEDTESQERPEADDHPVSSEELPSQESTAVRQS